MSKLTLNTSLLWSIVGITAIIAAEDSPVSGGVIFRTDDNGTTEYWVRRTKVFAKNKIAFGAAVNLVGAEVDPVMIAAFKKL